MPPKRKAAGALIKTTTTRTSTRTTKIKEPEAVAKPKSARQKKAADVVDEPANGIY